MFNREKAEIKAAAKKIQACQASRAYKEALFLLQQFLAKYPGKGGQHFDADGCLQQLTQVFYKQWREVNNIWNVEIFSNLLVALTLQGDAVRIRRYLAEFLGLTSRLDTDTPEAAAVSRSVDELEAACVQTPYKWRLKAELAKALIQEKKYPRAIYVLNQAIRQADPEDVNAEPGLHLKLARVHYLAHQKPQAWSELEKASSITNRSKRAEIQVYKALLCLRENAFAMAAEFFDCAFFLMPYAPRLLATEVQFLAKRGLIDKLKQRLELGKWFVEKQLTADAFAVLTDGVAHYYHPTIPNSILQTFLQQTSAVDHLGGRPRLHNLFRVFSLGNLVHPAMARTSAFTVELTDNLGFELRCFQFWLVSRKQGEIRGAQLEMLQVVTSLLHQLTGPIETEKLQSELSGACLRLYTISADSGLLHLLEAYQEKLRGYPNETLPCASNVVAVIDPLFVQQLLSFQLSLIMGEPLVIKGQSLDELGTVTLLLRQLARPHTDSQLRQRLDRDSFRLQGTYVNSALLLLLQVQLKKLAQTGPKLETSLLPTDAPFTSDASECDAVTPSIVLELANRGVFARQTSLTH